MDKKINHRHCRRSGSFLGDSPVSTASRKSIWNKPHTRPMSIHWRSGSAAAPVPIRWRRVTAAGRWRPQRLGQRYASVKVETLGESP